MQIFLDTETIPEADKQRHITKAIENFKPPSSITKGEMAKDLELTESKVKHYSKAQLEEFWVEQMRDPLSAKIAEKSWRDTALNANHGRIFCIGWESKGQQVVNYGKTEKDTLLSFFNEIDLLRKHHPNTTPYFVGHNITFDLKFLWRRAMILGIKPTCKLPFKGRHGKDYYCTMQAWCEFGERVSLDNLGQLLGFGGKGEMDGSVVCDAWLAGEEEKILKYVMEDVVLARNIYRRFVGD